MQVQSRPGAQVVALLAVSGSRGSGSHGQGLGSGLRCCKAAEKIQWAQKDPLLGRGRDLVVTSKGPKQVLSQPWPNLQDLDRRVLATYQLSCPVVDALRLATCLLYVWYSDVAPTVEWGSEFGVLKMRVGVWHDEQTVRH